MTAPCPNAKQHAKEPAAYLAWDAWAERKSKTHRQERCPGCQRWKVWVKR